jgi:hypothetical protein
MTRRGTLVYYLSAWILGCFFTSASVWIKDTYFAPLNHPFADFAFGLLYFYFFGLISGAVAALLAAFLLRRVMMAVKCKTPSHWALVGAMLTPAAIVILGAWGRHVAVQQRPETRWLELITFGPKAVLDAGWWLAIPAGAATAFLLCRIQGAFAPPKSAISA